MLNITRITLSHNRLKCEWIFHWHCIADLIVYWHFMFRILFIRTAIPPGIANLTNLEILNLANNHVEDLPVSLSSMPKLRILNLSINRLSTLPRGFGAFPVLEVLDLSYNNLNEHQLPGNFFMMGKKNVWFFVVLITKHFINKIKSFHLFCRNSSRLVFGR